MSKFIHLKTTIPGPNSLALWKRREASVPTSIYHATPLFVEHAEGAILTDVDGNRFIDFAGGIGTMNVGHCNPAVVEAASAQLRKLTHSCFSVGMYESYVALAEKLNRITPGDYAKKTLFANSGAEGVENAVKIARHFTGRPAVVAFEHAFHGRTLLTMSLTSKVKPYKFGFGPFAPEIYRLPYPYDYRNAGAVETLEEFFASHVAPENIACVVIELVLGEGGFVVAPQEYVKRLEALCKKYGILLVVDEVQTGFARTGKMFASEYYELQPDLIVMAKSIAGGMPLSAVTGKAEIMDHAQVGGLGGTFVGNPVSCAAALAAIEYIEQENLSTRAFAIGKIVRDHFLQAAETHQFIGDVRGLGAMMALEIVKDRKTKEPDKERTAEIVRRCYTNGLIVLTAGTHSNVIRTLMPLVISDEQLVEGLEVLKHAMQ
jgi:4-aminobutyrate aminotransferase / (S)-3-amino-2-methylpropionate transaminase / 5-aminovalerate transaminase